MEWEHFLPEVQQLWQLRMELTICLIMATGHMVTDTTAIITMENLSTTSSSVRSLARDGSMEGFMGGTKCGNESMIILYFLCVCGT